MYVTMLNSTCGMAHHMSHTKDAVDQHLGLLKTKHLFFFRLIHFEEDQQTFLLKEY